MRILEEDPQLAPGLSAERLLAAARLAVGPVLRMSSGRLERDPLAGSGATAALVVEGLATCTSRLEGARNAELLAPGDIVGRPELEDSSVGSMVGLEWRVLSSGWTLVLLGPEVGQATARFPELARGLVARTARRTELMRTQTLIAQVRRLDRGIELLLWLLADRHGKVGAEGIRLELPLTHQLIAELLGAQRPSVSVAMRRLTEAGRLSRNCDGRYVLHGSAPELRQSTGAASAVTELIGGPIAIPPAGLRSLRAGPVGRS